MIEGVTKGFRKSLELQGVGYRVNKAGNDLNFSLGYSHPVVYKAPAGISFAVEGTNKVHVDGIDKQQVGQVAAEIRDLRPPEPYKGKGVRYEGEVVRKKLGKAGQGRQEVMAARVSRTAQRLKRHGRVRRKVIGTEARPRLQIFRSLHHTYAFVVDDSKGHTLVAASTRERRGRRRSRFAHQRRSRREGRRRRSPSAPKPPASRGRVRHLGSQVSRPRRGARRRRP